MLGIRYTLQYTCARCLRARSGQYEPSPRFNSALRSLSVLSPLRSQSSTKIVEAEDPGLYQSKTIESGNLASRKDDEKQGAMTRRLEQATEDAILEGGRAGRKAVEEAGFSDDLKERLLEKVKVQKFQAENATSFAEAGLTSKVGRGSREIATGQAWSGVEAPEDSLLRMLDDARKPLKPGMRGPSKIPSPIVDMRLKREPKQGAGVRLANARDKTSIYAISKDTNMSEKEREDMRKELKERFTPGARAMPNSITGLAALANERIENAIARGQFKNIPRGKAVVRDARADNPFLDTTEYIMNKMIKRQDIVPPWIEKQQELVKTASIFRARLRNDWKRHAARTISSRGGTLQDQMRAAVRYAEAELVHNPKKRIVEQISVPTNATSDPVMVNIVQDSASDSTAVPIQTSEGATNLEVSGPDASPHLSKGNSNDIAMSEASKSVATPLPAPFRIPSWEMNELSYLQLAISNLNSLTRTYNLMAPNLAKKPYFSLDRELKSCYADIAPELAGAIKERAARPERQVVEKIGHRPGSVLDRFSTDKVMVHDSKKPLYGFKEFWNDLFAKS